MEVLIYKLKQNSAFRESWKLLTRSDYPKLNSKDNHLFLFS